MKIEKEQERIELWTKEELDAEYERQYDREHEEDWIKWYDNREY